MADVTDPPYPMRNALSCPATASVRFPKGDLLQAVIPRKPNFSSLERLADKISSGGAQGWASMCGLISRSKTLALLYTR